MDAAAKKHLGKTFLLIFSIGYVVIMLLVLVSYFRIPKFLVYSDVISFLTGAKIVKEGKVDLLYNLDTQLSYQNSLVSAYGEKLLLPFRNFPVTAFFYIPLLGMDLKSSYFLVFIINIFWILSFHFIFVRLFPPLRRYKFLYLLPVFFYPNVSGLIVGQYTTIVLLIFLFIYFYIKRSNSFLTGFFTSLLVIKPQYLLFTPFSYAPSKKKKLYLKGFLSGILIFILVNIVISRGIKPLLDYPSFILSTETSSFGSRPYQMYTLFALARQLFIKVPALYFLAADFIGYVIISALILCRKKVVKDLNTVFSLGIVITVLFSVHALTHDLLISLIPIYLYLLSRKPNDLIKAFLILIGVGVFSLADNSFLTILSLLIFLYILIFDQGKKPLFSI